MTKTENIMFFRTATAAAITAAVILVMSAAEPCRCAAADPPPTKSYAPSPPVFDNRYHNNDYEAAEISRPLAVFTERPVKVADFVLIPVIQVPASELRMVYRPQIDGVSKTEPIVMCKSSSTKSFEATPAVQVPLQQPFYLYDERTLIPFPKTVTILHGGYRVSIPVGVVVAPVPVGVLRAGPVFVTTLYAIPAGAVPSPVPVRITPWSSYPSQYLASPPAPPPYSQPIPPLLPAPAPYPYLAPAPSYSQPAPAPSYSQPSSPEPSYSQPAPPAPTYYQHGGDYGNEDASDLRNRDPPGTLYSQYVAAAPFQNSKESPLLNQFREESEKNRQKYTSPSYSNKYQTIDA